MTGALAAESLELGTQVDPVAKEFVVNLFAEEYGVTLE